MATKQDKNVHLEHIEDEIINRGVAGGRDAINFLRSLRDMLAGHSATKVNIISPCRIPLIPNLGRYARATFSLSFNPSPG